MSEPQKDGYQHQYPHHPDQQPPPHQYGTFQGVDHHPPQPVIGFPQPVPPPGTPGGPPVNPYVHGYQAVPVPDIVHDNETFAKKVKVRIRIGQNAGYAVAEGRPMSEDRLPCCGIGIGWFLFIIGFFFAAIPWYLGAFILLCARYDAREKPGYVACMIAAILGTIAVIFGVAR